MSTQKWFPYQLADDEKTYGKHAGHWILVDESGDVEHPRDIIFPTRERAVTFAEYEHTPIVIDAKEAK